MGTTAQKLQNIIDSKAAISAAIEAKGGTVPTELTGYGAAIEALPSGGGSSDLAAKIVDGSVTEVTAADLSGVTSIGKYAFAFSNLSSIILPNSVIQLDIYAFESCRSLESINIPNSVTSINNYAFNNCSGLKSITIGTGVTSIGNNAFRATGLTSVTIPDNVTSIGTDLFAFSGQLLNVTLGNSLTIIKERTFTYCTSLGSIAFPPSVTAINVAAFQNCSNCLIYDFSNNTSIPTLANTNAFNNTNASKKIIVPDDLYDSWKAANNWNSSTNGIVDAITKASEA